MVPQGGGTGVARAQIAIGAMYYKGKGVPKSEYVAIDWWYKAGLSYLKRGEREEALSMLELIEKTVPGHFFAKKLKSKTYGGE